MTAQAPQTPVHGEVEEIRSQVAPAQVAPVEAVPAYYTPPTILDDVLDELAQAREMVRFLTRTNESLAAECDALIRDRDRWADEARANTSPVVAALTAQLESTLKDQALIIADRDRLREVLQRIADRPDYRLPAPRDIAREALGVSA